MHGSASGVKDGTLATTPRACFCFLQQPPLSRETRTSATTKITMPTTLSEQDYRAKHVHYDHQDLCKDLRWTAKESYEYLYNRPWKDIQNFYSHLLAGHLSLNDLVFHRKAEVTRTCGTPLSTSSTNGTCTENRVKKDRGGKWDRRTFKILLSYDGSYFDGWQKQPGLNTVQGLLEKTLGKFVGNKKVKELEAKGIPIEAAISVAGRTDKGVSALHQVCSFYTWRKDVTALEVEAEINALASECLKVASVYEVPREFHPNFSAKWRRYLYILPLHEGEGDGMCNSTKEILKMEKVSATAESECKQLNKPYNFDVALVNQFLQQLEGRSLSYKIFARDTQASRSSGPATECTMYHARAAVATLPCIGKDDGHRTKNVMCVELVANRFLRKIVRVLVATVVREATAGADPNIFLNLMEATCRRASAPPAPPDGLCLVDVGYEDINNENSIFLIN